MAWIEQRHDQHRVYWTTSTSVAEGRDYKQFDSREPAELFVELTAAMGNNPLRLAPTSTRRTSRQQGLRRWRRS